MSKFRATAVASRGVPSEKVTPSRILKVNSVFAALTIQDSAIQGSIASVFGFCQVSLSVIWLRIPPLG